MPCGQLLLVCVILKGFQKCRKKLKFFMTMELVVILGHFTYFSPKWANVYFLSVLCSTAGGSEHFKRLSRKSKKLKIFITSAMHIFADFSSKWASIYISSVLWSTVVFNVLKGFPGSPKNWSFSWLQTSQKIVYFWAFHIFTYLSHKWANIYFSSVLWSTATGLHHLKGF